MNTDRNPSNQPQELEPTAGSTRAPVWLFVLVAVLAFLGMGFLDIHGGGFHPRVYRPYHSIGELGRDQPATKVRAETKDRAGQWTVSELLDIPEK